MGTKDNPGLFDCFKKMGPNEPFFVLRAQDALAAELVELWSLRAKAAGCSIDKVNEAKNIAEEMLRWPVRKNPD
jgi:hypothetical protein